MRSKGQAPVVKSLNQHLYKFVWYIADRRG